MSRRRAGPLILGIESSCDETAAAVIESPRAIRSSVVASQDELHEEFGGVVPEIASRAHVECILPVVTRALSEAGITTTDIDAVAIGNRPGLIGSLIVGVSAAKALAWALDVPLYGIDHVDAHLVAALLDPEVPDPADALPALGLVISGGHTSLFHVTDVAAPKEIGRTIDDAAGEAFDKAAAILELGYPGGPAVERLAEGGNDRAHDLPVARLKNAELDFSFSGLKTALLYRVRGQPIRRGNAAFARAASDLTEQERADFAASFQRAVIRALVRNTERAFDRFPGVRSLLVGGGVSSNAAVREALQAVATAHDARLLVPAARYCVDNAAMIAAAGAMRHAAGTPDGLALSARSTRA